MSNVLNNSFNQISSGNAGDGKSLNSISHPVAPWWKRLWLRLFHRDLNPNSIETVEIELTQEMIDQSVAALAPKPDQFKPVKFDDIKDKITLHRFGDGQ